MGSEMCIRDRTISVPSETSWSISMAILSIFPDAVLGTSMLALSLSSVINDSSTDTLSPTLTMMSITLALSAPMSGTATLIIEFADMVSLLGFISGVFSDVESGCCSFGVSFAIFSWVFTDLFSGKSKSNDCCSCLTGDLAVVVSFSWLGAAVTEVLSGA